jgi:hypothetical protein
MREKGTLMSKAYQAYEPDQLFLMLPTSYNDSGKTPLRPATYNRFIFCGGTQWSELITFSQT